jgi:glutaredoxin
LRLKKLLWHAGTQKKKKCNVKKEKSMASESTKHATLYRMVTQEHICPYGVESLDLLKREGFEVEDKWLTTREQTDAFQEQHDVDTTPQTFINGKRIGGQDELKQYFGK